MRRLFAAAFVVAAGMVAVGMAQAPAPALRIVSPEDDTPVAGPIRIKTVMTPADTAIQRMTFFVDGRRVCTVQRAPFECDWNVGKALRRHTFRVVAYLADGRRVVANTIRSTQPEFVDNEDVDRVHVTVTVLDGDGKFVTGLDQHAFRVYEDDIQQPFTYFPPGGDMPLDLLTAIDVSGSMVSSIDAMKEDARYFLSALRPSTNVTLTAFNENFFVLARPTSDKETRVDAVNRLVPFGSTGLHDALFRSLELLGNNSSRSAIVMFSDGEDTSSRISRDAIERKAETSDAVLYMIGMGEAIKVPVLRALCVRLAQRSGGRAFFPITMTQVRTVFEAILAELSNQHLLSYAPPSRKRDATWHRIRVEVGNGQYQVRYRQGYRFKALR